MVKYAFQRANYYRKLVLKITRILYYIFGGIYFTEKLSRKIKTTYFCCSVTILVLTNGVGFIGCLLTVENLDLFSVISTLTYSGYINFVLVIVPAITQRHHSDIEILFDYLDEQSSQNSLRFEPDRKEITIQKRDPLVETFFWSVGVSLCGFLVVLSVPIDVFFVCSKENSFRDIRHHTFGIPYVHRIPSPYAALAIYVIEIFLSLVGFTILISTNSFLSILTVELNNVAVNYCEEIQNLIQVSGDSDKEPKMMNCSFHKKLVLAVKKHQALIK